MATTAHALLTDGSACTCGAPSPTGGADYLNSVEWFALHFTLTVPRRTR